MKSLAVDKCRLLAESLPASIRRSMMGVAVGREVKGKCDNVTSCHALAPQPW